MRAVVASSTGQPGMGVFVLPDDLRDLKFQAIAAHESQVEGLMEVFGRDLMQPLGEENFRLGGLKG